MAQKQKITIPYGPPLTVLPRNAMMFTNRLAANFTAGNEFQLNYLDGDTGVNPPGFAYNNGATIFPRRGVLQNFYFTNSESSPDIACAFTLQVNGADTPLTLIMPTNGTYVSNNTLTVTIPAGAQVRWRHHLGDGSPEYNAILGCVWFPT